MKQLVWRIWVVSSAYVSFLLISSAAGAQITPDHTVPTNVTRTGNVFEITGGKQVGGNLFHSFEEFSVPTGTEAFFSNVTNINTVTNIISRITGGSISNIDGLIKENYGANLILINPNGINFGSNAQLDIGGSFLASTANSLKFADGAEFSALNPQASPTLTISVPIGLQLGRNSGAINVQGVGHNLSLGNSFFSPFIRGSTAGLKVQPGHTLALIGSGVNLAGGTLTSEGGRIELGSVGEGLVSMSPIPQGWSFSYQGLSNFQDINLSQKALVDTTGVGSTGIQLQGRNISLSDGSVVLIQNQGSQATGNINLNASESLNVKGTTPDGTISSGLFTQTVGSGYSGDLTILTPSLSVSDGAEISSATYSGARGGNVIVNAPGSVQVMGFAPTNPNALSYISSSAYSSGKSGNATIYTGALTISNGARVGAGTFGSGAAGDIVVNATKSVEVIGAEPSLAVGSLLGVSTLSTGNAGSVSVNTPELVVQDGGRIDSSTTAQGAAGSITINAKDSVEVSGTIPGTNTPSLVSSGATIESPITRQILHLPDVPTGSSGDVTINTNQLSVTNNGQVTVNNEGTGNAGSLKVSANSIFLDNQGSITAATQSGEGGNITLKAKSFELRHQSQISAQASGFGEGGNISISGSSLADFVALLEGSKINANAFQGMGGNIGINTQGLFVCADCRITSSSTLGLDGVVKIVSPETRANFQVIDLAQEVAKPEQIVAQACPAQRRQNKSQFFMTGRGGLPPQPNESLSSEALVSFDPPPTRADNSSVSTTTPLPSSNSTLPPPARGWYTNRQGVVILTAQSPTTTPYSSGLSSSSCHVN